MHNAYFAQECAINEIMALMVHEPIALPKDPKDVDEARTIWDWLEAIKKELENVNSPGTLLEADQFGRAMKAKITINSSVKHASWCVAFLDQGSGLLRDFRSDNHEYYQVYHLPDCQICAAKGFFIATFDVTAAFLEGSADCRMFARMPLCLSSIRERVEIVGNWYGLKQGPKIWNDQLNSILLEIGFIRCPVHPCLYTRLRNEVFIILGVHVDDGLMGCNKDSEFDLFLTEFNDVTKSTIYSLSLM
jgi:hypothetical protein